jgi:hypothetical protein
MKALAAAVAFAAAGAMGAVAAVYGQPGLIWLGVFLAASGCCVAA